MIRPSKLLLGLEAAITLAGASLAVWVLPSSRLTRLLGRPSPPSPPRSSTEADEARGAQVGRAVERVAGMLPWRPVCLPQAIATRTMLRRRRIPCEGHLGVVGTAPFGAHAWVTVGDVVVQGASAGEVTEVAVLR